MNANAEKTALAEQRALKKAARRAAFIQEVAVAVCDEQARRVHQVTLETALFERAGAEMARLDAKANAAALAADSPLEALYLLNVPAFANERNWQPSTYEASRAKNALAFAIKHGILPADTAQLPDTQAQFVAYVAWKESRPQGLELVEVNDAPKV